MLRFSSANLKIHKLTVNVFTSVFPAYAFLWVCVCIYKEVAYGQCVYACCGAPPSTPLIVLHLLIGHSGYALTL